MLKKTKATKKEEIKRNWHLIDAKGRVLGRVATEVAPLILGKHKPYFTPTMDCGDKVVVINAALLEVTGNKMEAKVYGRHSGYPGGLRLENLESLLARRPEEVLRRAIWGMIPKNRLRKDRIKNVHIYAGSEHPHQAQFPAKGEDK